jgi:hypothetical protein
MIRQNEPYLGFMILLPLKNNYILLRKVEEKKSLKFYQKEEVLELMIASYTDNLC